MGLGNSIVNIIKHLIVAPTSVCRLCGRSGFSQQLCSACLRAWAELAQGKGICDHCGKFRIGTTIPGLCRDCRQEKLPFVFARAVVPYEGPVRDALYLFKFAGKQELAEPLGQLMAELVKEVFPRCNLGVVIPVPLHPARERERRFNQAVLLAEVVARHLHLSLAAGALRRCVETPSQTTLPRTARQLNLAGAFQFGGSNTHLQGKTVLLVDDVYTTGATAGECTRTLLGAGVRSVYVVTLATGVER